MLNILNTLLNIIIIIKYIENFLENLNLFYKIITNLII